jgi:MFS family permease
VIRPEDGAASSGESGAASSRENDRASSVKDGAPAAADARRFRDRMPHVPTPERGLIAEIGLTAGTLGSTAGQTVMVAVFPVLLAEYAPSAFWVGLAIGGEGVLALLVPYWVGALSDRLPARLARAVGRRMFFMLTSAPLMAITLIAAPYVEGYWPLVAIAAAFFGAFHIFLTPLWTLMVDAVPNERRGRVQGIRGVLHALGLGYGLVAGGLLLSVWRPLPFIIAAALILLATLATWWAAHSWGVDRRDRGLHGELPAQRAWDELKEKPTVRWFLAGNALWTGAVDGIRPYFFIFATTVIGVTIAHASIVLTLLVVGFALGSLGLGWVSDRLDRGRLLELGLWITAVAMFAGTFARSITAVIVLLLFAGIGAAALMALPYPLFASLVEESAMGQHTGFYVVSLGVGRTIAPIMIGVVIDFGARFMPAEQGYPLMWPAAGVLMALSAFALKKATEAS